MTTIDTSRRASLIRLFGVILCVLFATPALAGGGNVLPSIAKPRGYSLAEAAAATAYFNTGPRTADTLGTLPQDFHFQILYVSSDQPGVFSVAPGTMLYVPVAYSDSTDAALWPFPDVNDPRAVSSYYFDPDQLGAEYIEIVVDGDATFLGPGYAVGAETPGLPSGGNSYTVVGAFLAPLSKGTHTVTISARLTGAFVQEHPELFPGGVFEFETTYTVNVG